MSRLLYSLFGFEKTNKVKLFFIIAVHVLGWTLFFSLTFLFYPVRFENNHFWVHEIIGKLFPIGLFYLNYYFLLPRFFERKKLLSYFLLIFVAVSVVLIQDIVVKKQFQNRRLLFLREARESFERRAGESFLLF